MSTDIITLQNQLPEDIRSMLAQQVAADIERLGNVGGKDIIRITQDKKFQLPNGATSEYLEVAIVDFVYRNEYYKDAFNRKAIQPPVCFAISPVAAELTPSDNSPMKQSTSTCAACQQNQWGSSPTGDGKACKNSVMIAVLPLDATADTPLMVIKPSPTAVRHFNAYVAKIARTGKVPVTAVATRLSFDPELTYASVRFELIGLNPVFKETMTRHDEARARLLQEPDVSAFELQAK